MKMYMSFLENVAENVEKHKSNFTKIAIFKENLKEFGEK